VKHTAVWVIGPDPYLTLLIPFGKRYGLTWTVNHFNHNVGRRGGDRAKRSGCGHPPDIQLPVAGVSIYELRQQTHIS